MRATAPLIRSAFVPDGDDDWGRNDLSQIEYRGLVHYAKGHGADEARRMYNRDRKTDFHRYVADICGIDPENKSKRKGVKGINFAGTYGAGEPKLVRMICAQTGMTPEEAREVVATYKRELPFAERTLRAVADKAQERGYIVTILGRRQRFPFWEPRSRNGPRTEFTGCRSREEAEEAWGLSVQRSWTHKALNRLLQGSAADHMKKAMVCYYEAGIDKVLGAPLLTVHDELDLSVPRTAAGEEAFYEVSRVMETCIEYRVPIIAEAERGSNWGDCK